MANLTPDNKTFEQVIDEFIKYKDDSISHSDKRARDTARRLIEQAYDNNAPFVIMCSAPDYYLDPIKIEEIFRSKYAKSKVKFFTINNYGNCHWDCTSHDVDGTAKHIPSSGSLNSCGAYTLLNIIREGKLYNNPPISDALKGLEFSSLREAITTGSAANVNSIEGRTVRDFLHSIITNSRGGELNDIPLENIEKSLGRIRSGQMLESDDIVYASTALGIHYFEIPNFAEAIGSGAYRDKILSDIALGEQFEIDSLCNFYLDKYHLNQNDSRSFIQSLQDEIRKRYPRKSVKQFKKTRFADQEFDKPDVEYKPKKEHADIQSSYISPEEVFSGAKLSTSISMPHNVSSEKDISSKINFDRSTEFDNLSDEIVTLYKKPKELTLSGKLQGKKLLQVLVSLDAKLNAKQPVRNLIKELLHSASRGPISRRKFISNMGFACLSKRNFNAIVKVLKHEISIANNPKTHRNLKNILNAMSAIKPDREDLEKALTERSGTLGSILQIAKHNDVDERLLPILNETVSLVNLSLSGRKQMSPSAEELLKKIILDSYGIIIEHEFGNNKSRKEFDKLIRRIKNTEIAEDKQIQPIIDCILDDLPNKSPEPEPAKRVDKPISEQALQEKVIDRGLWYS